MELRVAGQIPDNQSIIYVIQSDTDLAGLGLNTDQINFLKWSVKNEKAQVSINTYNSWNYFIIDYGEKSGNDRLEFMRVSGYHCHKQLVDQKIKTVYIKDLISFDEGLMALAEGLILSNYQFLKYFKDADKKKYDLKTINIVGNKKTLESEVKDLNAISDAVYFARDLINEPLSYLTAEKLSEEIKNRGEKAGLKVEIFTKKKIEALKMGGLLAVNRGSIDPPTFTVLEWKPQNSKNKKPLVLVGKGVVYDTGGLSLKPTKDSMDYMKADMSGAAAVAGIMCALGEAQVPVYALGLIPATDNRPDGNAYTPGDVIHMGNGMTVEVLNTDAEGRMILAEALHYAKKYKPSLVIDIATLTGSAAIAIGKYGMVGMGNADKEVFENLKRSADRLCERIVEFPFWDDYKDLLKSSIADIKNIGGREGGAITAGKFLEYFTDYPYIHLDIAGSAFVQKEYDYRGTGGTGYGIRTLFDFIRKCELL